MRLSMILCCLLFSSLGAAQTLRFADLSAPEIKELDRSRTVLILPGGILEEHGPFLPSGADGIFSKRLANDLARALAKDGWTVVMLPEIPLGAGAANEIGRKYLFPGSVTVLPSTLRAVYMDLADQLGGMGFVHIVVANGHADPAHNRMLDQAGDYFHDTYGGSMINLFGCLWAMKLADLRTEKERQQDGLSEHAGMTETAIILALQPGAVRREYRSARPHTGQSMEELENIAAATDWPGYFGAPSLATAALGRKIYQQWLSHATDLVRKMLAGEDLRKTIRLADVYADDPADKAAIPVNSEREAKHKEWLMQRGLYQ